VAHLLNKARRKHIFGLGTILLLVALFKISPVAEILHGHVLDEQFQVLRHLFSDSSADNIVVVGIDEQTYESFDRPSGIWHHYVGEFLLAAAESQPESVVVDLLFERWYKDLVPNHYVDLHRGLLAFRKNQIPLVLGVGLESAVEADGSGASKSFLREVFPYPAIRAIMRDDKYFGLAIAEKDPDGVLRRQIMNYEKCPDCTPSMLARLYEQLGETHASGLINFVPGKAFDYVPLHDIIQWRRAGELERIKRELSGKAIFLGAVTRFEDRHIAPLPLTAWESGNRQTPGVIFMAQAMRSINSGGLIKPLPGWIVAVILMLAIGLWFLVSTLRSGLLILALWVLLLLAGSAWLLTVQREMPTGLILFASVIACSTRAAFEAWESFRERRRLSASFGAYVSPDVMQQIVDGTINPEMTGSRQKVCVMFSDIRNFTSRSESQLPESIIELLNLYFEEMTDAVDAHGGTIDKFIGDGLMVFFGAPNTRINPSQDAFDTAKSMIHRLQDVNAELVKQHIEPIEIGIGMHTGEAIIGHVGSFRRHEYTAIGDTVNIAARLEGLTKALNCPIVCSHEVFSELKEQREFTALGDQAIKGRAAVAVYGWKS
jgi:class 3 adenylate cyclase